MEGRAREREREEESAKVRKTRKSWVFCRRAREGSIAKGGELGPCDNVVEVEDSRSFGRRDTHES